MNRSTSLFALLPVALWLTGCSGSSAPTSSPTPTEQNFGPLTTRIVGTATPPVTSSAAFGANVTGIAGALIDRLALNAQGPSTLSDTKIAFYSTRDGNAEIYVMNADGTNPVRLTNDASLDNGPTWSPDGTKIAFTSLRDGNFEIYTMNADGTNQTRVTNNAATDSLPTWSPDGTKIAFYSNRDVGGNGEIYVMNADGTGQTRLTNNVAVDIFPSWSPDGAKIVFASERDGNSEIYLMNADGTSQTRRTNNAAIDYQPTWSPDGTKIAFDTNRDGNYEIYTMNADGTGQTRITNNTATDDVPSWSPDGTKIVFTSTRDGNLEIYSMSAFGGSETNLTKLSSVTDVQPAWSGYLPRTPKTLIGVGSALGATAAGFLYSQNGAPVSSVVAFDTSTAGSRAAARVTSQSAPFNDQGRNLIFSITTSAGLASVKYVNVNEAGVPGAAISPTIPIGSTGAIVSFVAFDGTVASVLPYSANRSASLKPTRTGDNATYSGNFTAVYDASGKNLAPGGAKSVTLDEKTGKLVKFE